MESERLQENETMHETSSQRSPKASSVVASRTRLLPGLNDASAPPLKLGQGFRTLHSALQQPVQTKLTINQPGDEFEQEADRVSEQVMRMPDPAVRLQRKSAGDAASSGPGQQSEAPLIQRRTTADDTASSASAPDSVYNTLRSPGQSLDSPTRAFFEARFQQDFGDVRVHTDKQAATSAEQISARAYTVGRDIVFGSGEYAPKTMMGQQLLAHELAHVVQQRSQVWLRVLRQPIHMVSGRFVGQIGGAVNNDRDEVLEAMDRLAEMNAYPSGPVYQRERTAVAAQPAGAISTSLIPQTISAISANDSPVLDVHSARFLGLTLTDTVGRGMRNASNDILHLQDMLHVNWHITNFDYGVERAAVPTNMTSLIPDIRIPKTIEGITKLKRAYVGGLHTTSFRRQLSVLASALTEVGRLNWVPFSTGQAVVDPARLQSEFGRWALIPGEPEPNSVSGRVNCWEMILLSAYRAGYLSLARIRQIYSLAVDNVRQGRASRVGDTVERELRGGRRENILNLNDPDSPQPHAGDMVIFDTAANHAAISTGFINFSRQHEILSLFNVPNAISQVQQTTIEDLLAAGVSGPVRFWGVNW